MGVVVEFESAAVKTRKLKRRRAELRQERIARLKERTRCLLQLRDIRLSIDKTEEELIQINKELKLKEDPEFGYLF